VATPHVNRFFLFCLFLTRKHIQSCQICFFAVSFASLGFISLYMAGKLGVFNEKGRGQSLRLLVSLLPLLIALTVALSRTCDYHHHWQGIDKQKTRPHFVLLFF
jgi:hypothetical protein